MSDEDIVEVELKDKPKYGLVELKYRYREDIEFLERRNSFISSVIEGFNRRKRNFDTALENSNLKKMVKNYGLMQKQLGKINSEVGEISLEARGDRYETIDNEVTSKYNEIKDQLFKIFDDKHEELYSYIEHLEEEKL